MRGGSSRLDSFEIDGAYVRGDFHGNLQYTIGRQKEGAFNGGDSKWWGISALAAQRVTPALTLAARVDYLNNEKNGGGTINVYQLAPSTIDQNFLGDFYNGFGPGMVSNGDGTWTPGDINHGANRYGLTFSATYRLTPNVAFRGELRHDHATTNAFYFFNDQTFRKTNDVFGAQTIINF
jgi:hypothetical protein